MEILSMILVAISLSMDAFSLALAYGTLGLENKLSFRIAFSVGVFHFFMPLLGMSVKYYLVKYSGMSLHFITSVIYFYLGIMLLLESKEDRKVSKIGSFKDIILFSIAVSLDSLSVGIAQQKSTILGPIFYALFSFFFTTLGLKMGKKLNYLFGKTATIIGGIFFLLLALFHL